jgi:hypothetical protein
MSIVGASTTVELLLEAKASKRCLIGEAEVYQTNPACHDLRNKK